LLPLPPSLPPSLPPISSSDDGGGGGVERGKGKGRGAEERINKARKRDGKARSIKGDNKEIDKEIKGVFPHSKFGPLCTSFSFSLSPFFYVAPARALFLLPRFLVFLSSSSSSSSIDSLVLIKFFSRHPPHERCTFGCFSLLVNVVLAIRLFLAALSLF